MGYKQKSVTASSRNDRLERNELMSPTARAIHFLRRHSLLYRILTGTVTEEGGVDETQAA